MPLLLALGIGIYGAGFLAMVAWLAYEERRPMATVIRTCGTEQGQVFLQLDCGHFVTVPVEDEETYSFIGSETDCDADHKQGSQHYVTPDEAFELTQRTDVLAGIWTDDAALRRLVYIAVSHLRDYPWLSEYKTREDRCRTSSQ